MIDDSIVRGTTSDRIVRMLREAGATEVHVRISSPPFLWPCYFGTDIPEREQLIAYNRTMDQIREVIGADSLGYLEIPRLEEIADGLSICKGCFTGKYPIEPPKEDIRMILRDRNERGEYHVDRQIQQPAIRALCQQGNAVYFFPGYEIPYLEKTLDCTGRNRDGA